MNKHLVAESMMWKFLERGGVQVAQLIVSIIIARLVTPTAYGVVALLSIFIALATVFVQSGLSTALIQKKDTDDIDTTSVIFYSLSIAVLLYSILFICAPWIATFFNLKGLAPALRVLALILFPGAITSIQLALLSKRMLFRKQFYANMFAAISSGLIGITMAYYGFESWALVGQQLSYQTLLFIVLCFLVKLSPKFVVNFQRTKILLSYGVKLLGSNLIDMLYHNLESLIIGKLFNPATLAFCNKGKMFPMVLINNIDGSVQSVMLPAYSASQDNIFKIKQMLRRTITLSTYLVFPLMILLAVVGRPTILLLLGEKWLGAVPYLQLFCFMTMLFPLQTAMFQAINAIGCSSVTLRLMVLKRSVGVVLLLASVWMWRSPYSVVIAAILIEFCAVIINVPANRKLFEYTPVEMLSDILPNLGMALISGFLAWTMSLVISNSFLLLLVQLMTGIAIYIGISLITHNHSLSYIINLLPNKKYAR